MMLRDLSGAPLTAEIECPPLQNSRKMLKTLEWFDLETKCALNTTMVVFSNVDVSCCLARHLAAEIAFGLFLKW
jgi:hypothetical protein